MRRVHIVGCPRSGTTLLMEMLATCFSSDGYCAHEMSIFEPPPASTPEQGLYFSKQPNDIKQLRWILPRDEQLYVIYLGRDPRAVICSRHRSLPDAYFCNYRVWHECDTAAQRYANNPRFLRLRYEDLVARPDAVQRDILAALPFLEQQHRFSEYHIYSQSSAASEQAMHGLRAANTERVAAWHQHLPRLVEQVQRYPQMAADLIRLGYETDESWLEQLQGIEPILYACRYPERRPWLRECEKSVRVWFKSRRYLKNLV